MEKRTDLNKEDLYPLSPAPQFQNFKGYFLLRTIEQANVKNREHDALEESCADERVHEETAIADTVAAHKEVCDDAESNDEQP